MLLTALAMGVAGAWCLAWRVAPISSVVLTAIIAALLAGDLVELRELPLVEAAQGADATVERWQDGSAHEAGCYFRELNALGSGEPGRLDAVAADCVPR